MPTSVTATAHSGHAGTVSTQRARADWLTPVWLLLMTVAVYLPVARAGFIWDDDAYVIDNQNLQSLDGLRRIWLEPTASPQYYPVVFTTFWIEYHVWQLDLTGYHLVNVLLHAANAVLLWGFLSRLKVPGAFLAAAVFAVHPVHVESVAWITERKNVLSGFFYLIALRTFWSSAASPDEDAARPRGRLLYAASLISFIGALLSKSVTASLPAAIAVLLWWQYGRVTRRQVVWLIPYAVLGAVAGLHTAHLEAQHVGAAGADWDWTIWERCLIAGRVPWFYLGKLLWPHPLIFIYPKWHIDPHSPRQALAPLATLLLIGICWWQRRTWGRGPLAAVLFFGGTLFPVLGFANVYPMRFSFVADHFQYLASLGMIVLVVGLAARFTRRWQVPHALTLLAAMGMLVVLGSLTHLRCYDYRDRETLWTATAIDNPQCWLAPLHLGHLRFEQGRVAEAALLFDQVVQLKDGQPVDPAEMADLHSSMADCYAALGDSGQARFHERECLKYMQQMVGDPFYDRFEVHYGCGILHRRLQEFDQAAREFRLALEIDPDHVECNRELGELLLQAGELDESATRLRRVLEIEPQNVAAHYNLALVYQLQGEIASAQAEAEAALSLRPDFILARRLLDQLRQSAVP